MRRIICDECKVEVEADQYGLAPAGWVTVRVAGPYVDPIECCGVPCTLIQLTKKQAAV